MLIWTVCKERIENAFYLGLRSSASSYRGTLTDDEREYTSLPDTFFFFFFYKTEKDMSITTFVPLWYVFFASPPSKRYQPHKLYRYTRTGMSRIVGSLSARKPRERQRRALYSENVLSLLVEPVWYGVPHEENPFFIVFGRRLDIS